MKRLSTMSLEEVEAYIEEIRQRVADDRLTKRVVLWSIVMLCQQIDPGTPADRPGG